MGGRIAECELADEAQRESHRWLEIGYGDVTVVQLRPIEGADASTENGIGEVTESLPVVPRRSRLPERDRPGLRRDLSRDPSQRWGGFLGSQYRCDFRRECVCGRQDFSVAPIGSQVSVHGGFGIARVLGYRVWFGYLLSMQLS